MSRLMEIIEIFGQPIVLGGLFFVILMSSAIIVKVNFEPELKTECYCMEEKNYDSPLTDPEHYFAAGMAFLILGSALQILFTGFCL